MRNDLLRDLLIVNRRIFDEAVASIQAQANRDIDRALREASLWAYEQAYQSSKSELQRINTEAQRQAERRIAPIQATTASEIDTLKKQHHEREQRIREHCEQLENRNQGSQCPIASGDQCTAPRDGE